MKKIVLLIQMLLCTIVGFTQITQTNTTSPSSPESITLVTYGDGKNKDEAINVALRSAIEQTFGTFVSANTSILNDELIKDEIVSISSGNIEDYKELDYQVLPDGRSTVTLQATVSINKLVSYAQSKGSSCELNTSAFIAQLNYKKLQKESIKKAWEHFVQMKLEESRNCITEVNITNIEMKEADTSGLGVIVTIYFDIAEARIYCPRIDEFRKSIGNAADFLSREDWEYIAKSWKDYNRCCTSFFEDFIVFSDNLGWTERLCFSDDYYIKNPYIPNRYKPDMRHSAWDIGSKKYERYYPMQDYEKLTNIQVEINNNVNDYLKELKEYHDKRINMMIEYGTFDIGIWKRLSGFNAHNTEMWLINHKDDLVNLYNYAFAQYIKKCKNIDDYCKGLSKYFGDERYWLSDENKKILSDECRYHY